jgi:hypothetical protein
MTQDQKAVATGALSGIVFIAASVWVLHNLLPAPNAVDAGDKLAYAAQWIVLAAVPFFAMIVAVGNARFFSEAIDPTRHKESLRMEVDGRVADNTGQQLLLFVIGSLGLAVTLSADQLPIIGAAAITFVIVRIGFWIGYRIRPVYRAFGFAGTAYLNLSIIAAALWRSVT